MHHYSLAALAFCFLASRDGSAMFCSLRRDSRISKNRHLEATEAMIKLHCLGAGAGVTAIYNGEPSSSWALSMRG